MYYTHLSGARKYCLQVGSLDMTSEDCDRGYAEEVTEMCLEEDDAANCLNEALGLLQVMKSRHHPARRPAPQCFEPCVLEILLDSS